MKKNIFLFFLCFCSCTPTSHWKLDAITAGEEKFNVARLKYIPTQITSPLYFELSRVNHDIEAYLNLTRYNFLPSKEDPCLIKISLVFEKTQKEDWIPLLAGSMRLHLPSEMTQQIIESLQKGEKVSILVDSFEQELLPELFSKYYGKLTGSTIFFQNPIKGPLQ